MELKLRLGVFAPTIAKQLDEQGFKYDKDEVNSFHKSLDSVTQLYFAAVVTDTQKSRMIKKLYNQIERHVRKVNKLKKVRVG